MNWFSIRFALFLLLTIVVNYIIPRKYRYIWLFLVSYFFLLSYDIKAVFYIIAFTAITYLCGLLLTYIKKEYFKKLILLLSIGISAGMLLLLKYSDFIIQNINRISGFIGFSKKYDVLNILMPIGISFFTLTAIGYLIDVYTEKRTCEKNILKYALFISFFPIIISGPIERSDNLLKEIDSGTDFIYSRVKNGLLLIAWGLYKKVIIAEGLSVYVNRVFDNYELYCGIEIILIITLYSVQLYADFSGYTDIARGISQALGFHIVENFRQPYFSTSVKDFWRRWHISLSSWFRDYIYIPLGGNRKGKLRTYINVLIVFCVSGLWHGAAWNFVFWGILHGMYQIAGGLLTTVRRKIISIFKIKTECFSFKLYKISVVYLLVTFAWIFFRATGLKVAFNMIKYILNHLSNLTFDITMGQIQSLIILVSPLLVVDILHENNIILSDILSKQNLLFRWFCYTVTALFFIIIYLRNYGVDISNFLYTQF